MTHTNNFVGFELHNNKAGNTATPVACSWAGTVFEVIRAFGQEQCDQRPQKQNEVKCDAMTDPTTWTDKRNTRLEKKNRKSRFCYEN